MDERIIKRWLGLKWNPDKDNLLDVEENDKGHLRIKKVGDKWGQWQPKSEGYYNAILIKTLNTTPPSEDYTKPNEDRIKGIDALKRWLGDY